MLFAASVLVALLPFVATQTSTNCDPTKKSCPDDPGFSDPTTTFNFQQEGLGNSWTALGFADKITQDSSGLHFVIDASGEAPTLASKNYVFFGKITAVVKAADGAGIVSSVILQSDDLDEIDWEWLGGDTTQVQTNYFSKGDTTTYDRGGIHPVANPQTTLHTYVIDWSETKIDWIIDGTVVRTLTAASVGAKYPQSPCQIRIGSWCGGCPNNAPGTIQWSGGPTTFGSDPYVMTIQSIEIENYNPGGSYKFGDMSGTASSIIIGDAIASNSTSSASSSSPSSSASTPKPSSSSSPSGSSSNSSSSGFTNVSGTSDESGSTSNTGSKGTSTIVNVGPTNNNLNSSASKTSYGAAAVLIFGMIVLLA